MGFFTAEVYVYLPHSIMKYSFSIIVIGVKVAMLSLHKEPDNIQFVLPDDEKKLILL